MLTLVSKRSMKQLKIKKLEKKKKNNNNNKQKHCIQAVINEYLCVYSCKFPAITKYGSS